MGGLGGGWFGGVEGEHGVGGSDKGSVEGGEEVGFPDGDGVGGGAVEVGKGGGGGVDGVNKVPDGGGADAAKGGGDLVCDFTVNVNTTDAKTGATELSLSVRVSGPKNRSVPCAFAKFAAT